MQRTLRSSCAVAAIVAPLLSMAWTSPAVASQPTPPPPKAEDQAQGQQNPNTTDAQAEPQPQAIVVTAQKRTQYLKDVPLSIQAYTGAELEKKGTRDLSELITHIPGASEGRGNAAGIMSYQIRGVASYYGDSTVGYYLDEAAYVIPNRNYAPVARTFDIDRVEVLRGPQGTLYGLGSMGGTIRFITASPDLEQVQARGDAGYSFTKDGDDNYYGDAALSVPIVKGRLAIRGTGSFERTGGYASVPSAPDVRNWTRFQNYRGKVLAKPVDALRIELTYQHNDTFDRLGRNLFYSPLQPIGSDPKYPNVPVAGLGSHQKYDLYTGAVGLDLGAVKLESSTGYIHRTDESLSPIVLGPAAFRLNANAKSKSFVQEVRAVSATQSPFQWVAGAIYMDAKSIEDIKVVGGPPISGVSEYDSKSWAVFGEASLGLFDNKLRPLIGLRYFKDDRDFISQNRPPGPVLPPPFTTSKKFDSVSPRFNLSFEPTKNSLYYVNIAKGFRSGTFNTSAAVAITGGQVGYAVNPDHIWSYELGTKQTILDNLYVEAAIYRLDWTDVQLSYTFPPGVQVIRNGGNVRGTGLDYLINWRPLTGLTLEASGNFNKTKFTSIANIAPAVFPPSIAVGKQLASVPKRTFNFSGTYRHPLTAGTHLYLNGSYSYIGRQGDLGDPAGRLGSAHDLVRARAGVEWRRFGIYAFGENLLNDKDPIIISGSTPPSFGTYTRYYPRVIGVELKFGL